jgi:UDP-glucose/iron transport system permease protein
MNGAIDISIWGLLTAVVFIIAAGAASIALKLKLEKDLLWGTLRAVSQLVLMGFVLRFVFTIDYWFVVVGIYALMILFAAFVVKGRVKEREVPIFAPTFISMLLSYMIVAYLVVAVIVNVEPWYEARYFIPLGGMVIGNSMSAIAIALERLLSDLRNNRDLVEMHISLGADSRQASERIFRQSIKAGMIPSITSLMGVGVVFIPGMMTGQILAGSDPLLAVKYQIVVMLMLVGSTAIGSVIIVSWVRRRCFDADDRLLLKGNQG